VSYLSSRLAADPIITIEYGAEVSELHGAEELQALTVRDVKTGATRRIETRALFIRWAPRRTRNGSRVW
jgi:thioredoxin reductase (NADPH)